MNLSLDKIGAAISRSITENFFSANDNSVIFYDLEILRAKIEEVKHAFPTNALHAIAIKANPLSKILNRISKWGMGAEAASLPELYLAQKAGFPPHKIVFDSPAKTVPELEYALREGVYINADSFEELKRIDELLKKVDSMSKIGIRLNPQAGAGAIVSSSTAGEYSKFGIPVIEFRDRIIESFINYAWLYGVHIHIGSQGCSGEMLLKGAEILKDFINEVNTVLAKKDPKRHISTIDIGGGLPVKYKANDISLPVTDYAGGLRGIFEHIENSEFKLITEFGRYVYANSGFVASRVEYVKSSSGIKTAIIHVGADLLLRRCYRPDDWYHEISVLDSMGKPKTENNKQKYNIAGPLCFSGDMLASDIELPIIEPRDIIVIHDTGAYTVSMWSRYNSRKMPKIIGINTTTEEFEIIKERENLNDLFKFWS
ncbi:MAG: diaminopimelate decarboxylase [candidate division Zixibacteria bacterium]